ncbi:MAG TPA: choice-of-anchor D domain-containing protein [Casimicrobiaceae bacterium]|nr:choice-of-anchor D domain-containing protein [Casimicrobiaceae bacterium]
MSRLLRFLTVALAAACAFAASTAGAVVTWNKAYSGLVQPVDIVNAHDGSGRLFLVQQTGQIRVVKNGALLATPFIDLTGVTTASGEQGLLGLVFHPQFATNRQFFVNYTRTSDGATVVARYTVPTVGSDTADPTSAQVLLVIAQPYTNHNGGSVRFGADGYLYIGMGDGGSGNDPQGRAQDKTTLLGKILRIDVDHGSPYAIPAGNPYANGVGGLPEIFAIGLRNPWRFSFDRNTGDFWIGDVGQDAVEEIDLLPAGTGAGANLGWRVMEGNQCTGLSGPVACNDPSLTMPVITYTHSFGCSVTGGYLYRGAQVPSLAGKYVYGDFCSGILWAATKVGSTWTPAQLGDTAFQITAFGEDEAGELYFTDYATGDIYKFADTTPPTSPTLSLTAASLSFGSIAIGANATQTISASNAGGGTLTLSSLAVSLPGSGTRGGALDFSRGGSCTNGTALTGAQTCSIAIQFAPSTTGARSGTLTVVSNGGNASVPLSGTGIVAPLPPTIAASMTTLDFGTVLLGSSAPGSLTLRNSGGGMLTLGSFTAGGANPGDFARGGTCATNVNLAANQACTVTYQFTPAAAGSRSASLTVASNGGSVTITLTGTGSTAPAGPVLTVSGTLLGFGGLTVGQSSAPQTVTLTNTGGGTLLPSMTPGGANPADFPISTKCSPRAGLSAGQSCTVTFTFKPTGQGARSATLAITSNGGNATISLAGTGL